MDSLRPPPTPLLERWLLAAVVLLGLAIRCAWLERLAVEHFDEGVYASNLWFGAEEGFAYPLRHLYAPPLVPAVAEWSLILSGLAPAAPLWAGVIAGVMLIPSLWWIGRQWFGATAGLSAAALAALSDVHAMFSRTILTDPWLVLWLAWAVYFLERALRARRTIDIVAAGLLTGVAWWTKYNGWLPLAFGLAGLFLFSVTRRPGWRDLGRASAAWAAVAAIACVVWAPVPLALGEHGGYAAVAANHRRYIVGLTGWWDSLAQQAANLRSLDSWLSVIAAPAAVAGVVMLTSQSGARRRAALTAACVAAPLIALSAGFGSITALALLTAVVLVVHFASSSRVGNEATDARSHAAAMLLGWFAFLSLATPMYTPYVRLTLPWLAAAWLSAGWAISEIASRLHSADIPESSASWRWRRLLVAGLLAATLAGFAGAALRGAPWLQRPIPAWEDRSTLAAAVDRLIEAAHENAAQSTSEAPTLVFYVYGEPAVFYHLNASGRRDALTTSHLNLTMPPNDAVPVFLIVGPHSEDDPAFAQQWAEQGQAWPVVAEQLFAPSDVMRLDHVDPRSQEEIARFRLRMYRMQ
ncbi:MAG: glycosyltransferase family 39 protein [Planctomycetes bacterium]|nr:glycosyltransferase family 39 protein [Planctomycetota bacterium]